MARIRMAWALLALALLCFSMVEASPQRKSFNNKANNVNGNNNNNNNNGNNRQNSNNNNNGNGNGNGQNNKQGARILQAKDGSMILDKTVQINGLPIRYRVSAPADQFTAQSGVQGANSAPNSGGNMGINVLLHGDGGQSFFEFPNQGVKGGLMGVAVLSPDKNRKWGGADRNGVTRPDGVVHSQAVNDLIQQELPNMVAFNKSNVFFTGVSGGSLTLSGFFMPAHMGNYPNTGVMLNCGALTPQVNFSPEAAAAMGNTRIHFQSTSQELRSLQRDIPRAVTAYEQAAGKAGLNAQQINALQTVNNSPNGGHCAFDGKGFNSGVQLMADNYQNVMQAGGTGQVNGIGFVSNGVVGNEKLKFSN